MERERESNQAFPRQSLSDKSIKRLSSPANGKQNKDDTDLIHCLCPYLALPVCVRVNGSMCVRHCKAIRIRWSVSSVWVDDCQYKVLYCPFDVSIAAFWGGTFTDYLSLSFSLTLFSHQHTNKCYIYVERDRQININVTHLTLFKGFRTCFITSVKQYNRCM